MLVSMIKVMALAGLVTAAAGDQAESLPSLVDPSSGQEIPPPAETGRAAAVTRTLPMALGLELGEASGLHVAYPLDKRQQISGLVGYSPLLSSLVVRSDYTYRFWSFVPDDDYGVQLSFFGGAGLRLGLFEPRPSFLRELPFSAGIRVPVGVAASLPPLPAELLLTLAPGGDAIPQWRFRLEGSLTLRFQIDLLTGKPWS